MDPILFVSKILGSPSILEGIGPGSIDDVLDLLDLCYREISMDPWPLVDIDGSKDVIVVGDLHGDLTVARAVAGRFLIRPFIQKAGYLPVLVFLGDYLDRPPEDTPQGGLLTAIFTMALRIAYPQNVILLRGNHEASDLFSDFSPQQLPEEIGERFGYGETEGSLTEFQRTFSTYPLMARTANGPFISHASFPRSKSPEDMTPGDTEEILRTLWGDPVLKDGFSGRMMGYGFIDKELVQFLEKVGSSCLIRGHDPPLQGIPMFNDRMMTIVTSRRYEKMGAGGILVARIPAGRRIGSVLDLEIIDIGL